jgi:hypothetical protein
MGRVHWLENNIDGGVGWLNRAVSLSPSYAQGVYARAWADTVSGRGEDGAENINLALSLSPLDPLRYAFLGVRAFTHIIRGEYKEGARWANDAAKAPGAHVLIATIAVAASALGGDKEKAKQWADNVRSRNPDLTQADFFQAFPFEHEDTRKNVSAALAEFGF